MESFTKKGKGKKAKTSLPWLNSECRNPMKLRDVLLKNFVKSGLTTDRLKFTAARNKVIQMMRKAKANFFITVMENARGDGKKLWQNINKLTRKEYRHNNNDLELIIDNKLESSPDTLASELKIFFLKSVENISKHFSPLARARARLT